MKWIAMLITTLVALAAIGCGGSGTVSSGSAIPSVYAGSYTGTWSSPSLSDSGAITFKVNDTGALNGTMARKLGSGNIVGTIDATGKLLATAGDGTDGGGTYVMSGNVAFQSGTLVSNFRFVLNGVEYGGTFSATASSGG